MQLYEKRAGGAQTQKLLKGLKRVVITSVVAMKWVEPLISGIPTKNPHPVQSQMRVIYTIGGDLLSHRGAHAVPSALKSVHRSFSR
jgi:hypothetical protein